MISHEFRLFELSGAARTVRVTPTALASGGDGAIHLIEGEPELVAKLYHEPGKDPTRLRKIQAMLADPPQLPPINVQGFRYIQTAWPLGWLETDRGTFTGYVMPLLDLSKATTLENLLAKKTRTVVGLPESYGYRLTAAANLAGLIAELHAHRHHIIDLKPINLNVYTDTFYMALLDCDGLSVHGANGKQFPAHQYTDGYICPEALQQQLPPQALGEDQDRFALAVIIFQLLNQGLHPYQGVPVKRHSVPPTNGERIQKKLYAYGRSANPSIDPSPWSIHEFFDNETRLLFDRAFTSRHDRPSAREWHAHLLPYTDKTSGKVRVCQANPEHVSFAKSCPWCGLEEKQRQQVSLTQTAPGKKAKRKRNRKKTQPPTLPRKRRRTQYQPHLTSKIALPPSVPQTHATKPQVPGKTRRLVIPFVVIFTLFAFFIYWFTRESYQLEHPVIKMQQGTTLVIAGSKAFYEHHISIVPSSPSSGDWETTSLVINGPDGKVKGDVSGSTFTLDDTLLEGSDYTVHASLKYTTTDGETIIFNRQWALSPWESASISAGPKPRKISADRIVTQKQLYLSDQLSLGAEIKFSKNGLFAFAGATGFSGLNTVPDGRILVFAHGRYDDWRQVGTLAPNTGSGGDSKERGFYWFGQNIEVSQDAKMVVTLSCVQQDVCNDLHTYERMNPGPGSWQTTDVLTINPDWKDNFFPSDFALAPNGDMLAVAVGEGIRIYRRNEGRNWQPVQMLPKPLLGDGRHLGGDLLFTDNGHHLFVGAPTSSRGTEREGAVLVYTLSENGQYQSQPEYISPAVTNGEIGGSLALSANEKVLAVSARGSQGKGEIHIFDIDNGQLFHSQVIKHPVQFETETQDLNFSRGFSLSYDGKFLLSGPSPYQSRHSYQQMGELQLMLYERSQEQGEYKPKRRILIEDIEFSLDNPPNYINAIMSPNGSTLILGNSGKSTTTRTNHKYQTRVDNGSLSFFTLSPPQ